MFKGRRLRSNIGGSGNGSAELGQLQETAAQETKTPQSSNPHYSWDLLGSPMICMLILLYRSDNTNFRNALDK
jgi:hypothetical protein